MDASVRACVTFADDVRLEEDEKLTLIGVYDNDIEFNKSTGPETIRLNAVVRIFGPMRADVVPPSVKVLLNRKTIREATMPENQIAAFTKQNAQFVEEFGKVFNELSETSNVNIAHIVVPFALSGVSRTSVLSVEVDIGYGYFSAGAIPVRMNPELGSEPTANRHL